jgi:hypothetical protein
MFFLHMDMVDVADEFEPASNIMGDPIAAWCDLMVSRLVEPSRDMAIDAVERFDEDGARCYGEMMYGNYANNTQRHERCAPPESNFRDCACFLVDELALLGVASRGTRCSRAKTPSSP